VSYSPRARVHGSARAPLTPLDLARKLSGGMLAQNLLLCDLANCKRRRAKSRDTMHLTRSYCQAKLDRRFATKLLCLCQL